MNEKFDISYKQSTYHYALYRYDKGNRLIATVPREGIDYINSDDADDVKRIPLHMQPDGEGENHGMKSKYTSNSLYTLSYELPDEGRTEFYYDKAGRVRFSRNAIQIAQEAGTTPSFGLNYTFYDDETGRIKEAGVIRAARETPKCREALGTRLSSGSAKSQTSPSQPYAI